MDGLFHGNPIYKWMMTGGTLILGNHDMKKWNHQLDSLDMEVSSNGGSPKLSMLMGCSIINHSFGGYPTSMETPI